MAARPRKAKRIKLICKGCGTAFERLASDVRDRRRRGSKDDFHSRECFEAWREKKSRLQEREAVLMRKKGYSYGKIGKHLGITKQRAHQILEEAG